MAELAGLLQSGAVVEPLRPLQPVAATVALPPAPPLATYPVVKAERKRKPNIGPQSNNTRAAAPHNRSKPARGKTRDDTAPAGDKSLQQWDEAILTAAKSAKDYRAWVLDNVALHIRAASEFHELQLPTAAGAVGDMRVKASELVNANVNAILDYMQHLASVQSPAEFAALSTSHAFRHFELIAKHAVAFALLKRA